MTYEEACKWVFRPECLNRNHSDARSFHALLDYFRHPEKNIKYIHVAGTNGKGSTCAFLASVLQEAGYRTGLYTSPHIHRVNERFKVNSVEINDACFADIVSFIALHQEKLIQKAYAPMIPFETLTLMAFIYFQRQKCDIVVLEVGVGGAIDPTNVIQHEDLLCAVITHIGFDHMKMLGNSLHSITNEKAGIIKSNCNCVAMMQDDEVLKRIKARCEQKQAKLTVADYTQAEVLESTLKKTVFNYKQWEGIEIFLIGNYELSNACTALSTLDVLIQEGLCISRHSVYKGMKETKWIGRCEVIHSDPLVIIDGAHNPQGVEALFSSLSPLLQQRKMYVVIGMLADKNPDKSITYIPGDVVKIYATSPLSCRALGAEDLSNKINMYFGKNIAEYHADIKDAVQAAIDKAGSDDVIIVLGSLYQVAEVRSFFGKNYFD